jgi:hypothetical protein
MPLSLQTYQRMSLAYTRRSSDVRHLEYERSFPPCHLWLETTFVETASECASSAARSSQCNECCAALCACLSVLSYAICA